MNRQIRQLAGGLMVCYVAAVRRPQLLAGRPPGGAQRHVRQHPRHPPRVRAPRGPIVTIDGVVVAESVENPEGSEFRYQRVYPTGELFGHITGYYTFAFGSTGVERTQNDVLTGETPQQQLRALPGIITGATPTTPGRCA